MGTTSTTNYNFIKPNVGEEEDSWGPILNENWNKADTALTAKADKAATNTFTARQIVSVTDNTNAALRVTQLGAGPALQVEDSTNPDSSPFIVDGDGRVLIGHTVAAQFNNYSSQFPLQVSNVSSAGAQLATFQNSSSAFDIMMSKSRGTSIGANGLVLQNDFLGNIQFLGSDGLGYISAARISAAVDGSPGTNDMPGRLVFMTTENGSSSPSERVRITSAGRVGIGTTSPQNTLDVDGAVEGVTFEVGHASDTTISRVSAGVIAVEGKTVALNGTSETYTVGTIELGAASDTTITRSAAGVIAVEGGIVPKENRANTFSQPQTFSDDVVCGDTPNTASNSVVGALIDIGTTQASLLLQGTSAVGDTTPAFRYYRGTSQTFRVEATGKIISEGGIDTGGSIYITGAGSLGYGTGAGGAVTQATSKATSVTLNKASGKITMNNAALASNAIAQFTLLNSFIAATDVVMVTVASGISNGADYQVWATPGTNSCGIYIRNISGGSLSEAVVLNFVVIKGVSA